jgi:hypothetical protein
VKDLYNIIIAINGGMEEFGKIIFNVSVNTGKIFTKTFPADRSGG